VFQRAKIVRVAGNAAAGVGVHGIYTGDVLKTGILVRRNSRHAIRI